MTPAETVAEVPCLSSEAAKACSHTRECVVELIRTKASKEATGRMRYLTFLLSPYSRLYYLFYSTTHSRVWLHAFAASLLKTRLLQLPKRGKSPLGFILPAKPILHILLFNCFIYLCVLCASVFQKESRISPPIKKRWL